jgi:hypothetical protein
MADQQEKEKKENKQEEERIKKVNREIQKEEQQKEQQEEQPKQTKEQEVGMSRGEILISSIFIELIVIAAFCVSPWFLPVSVFWKTLITIGGTFLTSVFNLLLVYFWWAPNNFCFTFVAEGTAKHIVAGKAYCKTLIEWAGHELVKTKSRGKEIGDVIEIKEVPKGFSLKRFTGKFSLRRTIRKYLGGLRCYGLWPFRDVLIFEFGWINRTQDGQIKKHPKETMDYLLLKDDVFAIEVKDAEGKDKLHVNILLILTLRVVNPYKASFVIQNWLETVINRIVPAVRNEYTKDTYANWISQDKDLAERIMVKLQGFLNKEFKKRYGIEARAIEVIDINPGKGYRELTLKEFTAEQEEKATIVNARAEAQRVMLSYQAVKEFGELGTLMKLLEAVRESPGEGAKWIIPLPGMGDGFSEILKKALRAKSA